MADSKLRDLSTDLLFVKSELIEREAAKDLYNQCGTIRRILISSINTAKENTK